MKAWFQFLAGLCLLACCLTFLVPSARSQPFGGIIAETTLTFGGNNIVDSYDSSDPTKSLWHPTWFYRGHNFGAYTNTLRTADVTVGTDGSVINLNGGVLIYGYVDTGSGGSEILMGSGNSVGDLAWVNANTPGIQPGHAKSDMNVVFNDVVLPTPTNTYYTTPTWLAPAYNSSGTNIGGITYFYMITNITGKPGTPANRIFYALDSGTIPNNKSSIFIGASNVVFYLPTGIGLKGANGLTLNTNDSSVEIYVGTNDFSSLCSFDTGNGAVNNYYQYAPPFRIFGLPNCTTIVFPGNANLTAWVYAPEADVTFYSGGSTPHDIAGAFMVHSIMLSAHLNFHFDESFGAYLPAGIFSQPTNRIIQAGSNATFIVNAGGSSLNYQWFFNQSNLIADAISPSLTLTNVQLTNAGNYSIVVSNLVNSVTSAPASLVVYTDATPVLSAVCFPTNGQFQFNIAGVTGLNYAVQTSTNLVDWIPLQTNVSPFGFTDTNMNGLPQRFYRSVFLW